MQSKLRGLTKIIKNLGTDKGTSETNPYLKLRLLLRHCVIVKIIAYFPYKNYLKMCITINVILGLMKYVNWAPTIEHMQYMILANPNLCRLNLKF